MDERKEKDKAILSHVAKSCFSTTHAKEHRSGVEASSPCDR